MASFQDFSSKLKSMSKEDFQKFYQSQPEKIQNEINTIIGYKQEKKEVEKPSIFDGDSYTGYEKKDALTPEQEQVVSRMRKDPIQRIGSFITTPKRFITGEMPLPEQVRENFIYENKLRDSGLSEAEILMSKLQSHTKESLRQVFHAAPFLTGGGLKAMSTIAGISKIGEELAKGEEIEDAASKGLITGAGTFLTGKGVEKAAPYLKKGVSAVGKKARKLADPYIQSELAKKAQQGLILKKQDLQRRTQLAVYRLKDKIESAKSSANDLIEKKVKNKITQNSKNLEKASESLDLIKEDIGKKMANFSDTIVKGTDDVRSALSEEYNNILKTKTGDTLIEVGDILDNALGSMGILSTSGNSAKSKLTSFIKSIMPELSGTTKKELVPILSKIQRKRNVGTKLELRDVHFIKQAFRDFASSMKSKASNQEFAFALDDIANSLISRVDESVGGEYGKLGSKWGKMLGMEKNLDSLLGKVENTLFRQRKGIKGVMSQLEAGIKEGQDITDKSFLLANDKIRGILTEVQYLRDNGMDLAADDIMNQMGEISNSLYNKNVFSKAKKTFESLKAESIRTGVKKEVMKEISPVIESLTKAKGKLERVKNDVLWKFVEEGRELEKKILDHGDISIIGTNIMANDLGRMIPPVRGALNLGMLMLAFKKYGGMSIDTALKGMGAIKSLTVRKLGGLEPSIRYGAEKSVIGFFNKLSDMMIRDEKHSDLTKQGGE